ncbi:unnamed protein product [Urochloa humidicola]
MVLLPFDSPVALSLVNTSSTPRRLDGGPGAAARRWRTRPTRAATTAARGTTKPRPRCHTLVCPPSFASLRLPIGRQTAAAATVESRRPAFAPSPWQQPSNRRRSCRPPSTLVGGHR